MKTMETVTPVVVFQGAMILALVAAWVFATLTGYGVSESINMAWLGVCKVVMRYGAYAGSVMIGGLIIAAAICAGGKED